MFTAVLRRSSPLCRHPWCSHGNPSAQNDASLDAASFSIDNKYYRFCRPKQALRHSGTSGFTFSARTIRAMPQIHTDYYKMQEYGTQTSARAFLRSNCHTTLFFSFSFLHNSHQIPWELYSTHTLEKVTQLLQLILPHAHQWGIKKTKKEYYCDEIYMLCTVTDRPHHGHPLLPGVCLPAWPPRSSGLSSSRPPVQPPQGTV